jgi:hypothetical protein
MAWPAAPVFYTNTTQHNPNHNPNHNHNHSQSKPKDSKRALVCGEDWYEQAQPRQDCICQEAQKCGFLGPMGACACVLACLRVGLCARARVCANGLFEGDSEAGQGTAAVCCLRASCACQLLR